MKKYSLFTAILIFVFTGWRDISWFGLPHPNKSVLITKGDGTMVDVAQLYYMDDRNIIGWQQGGTSHDLIHPSRYAEFWKPKPKPIWRYVKYYRNLYL